jgi:ribonuclease HI
LDAVRSANKNSTLTIISTQSYAEDAMNKKLSEWEHEGWVGVPHRDILRCLAAEVKARNAPTFFRVAAPGSTHRARCRQAAMLVKRAARAPMDEKWDLTLPQDTALPGLSLQGNRQKIFYRSIREEKTRNVAPRASTVKRLETVKKSIEDTFGRHVSDADIWKAAFNKDFLPRVAQFLWKGLHNAHRVGKYWNHIPECGDRAMCKDCNVVEDLDHILIGCKSPGQETIWKAAKSLWLEKESRWPEVSLGTVLGCGLAEFRNDRGKIKHGTQRLYRILISESAYLIWLLRNERVISRDGTPTTEEEIKNRWKCAVNQRLQVDKTLANRPTRGKRPALAPKLVLETWSNILDDERSLPADWLREPRVLVGSRAFPQAPTR